MVKKEEIKKESAGAEKKKPAAKKAAAKTASKKSVPKKASAKKAAPKKVPGTESRGKNRTPFFVLIIMALLTVILVLVNKQQNNNLSILSFFKKNDSGKIIKTEDFFPEDNKNRLKDKKTGDKKIPEKASEKSVEKPERKSAEKKTAAPADRKTDKDLFVKVYFVRLNQNDEKLYLASVKRKVSQKNKLRDSLSYLIKGPSPYEKKAGVLSAVPGNLRIRSVDVRGSTAVIDFNPAIESGATGSMLLKRIDQIVYTATQFDEIDNVRIRINGQYRKTLGSDGLSISGPLHRR